MVGYTVLQRQFLSLFGTMCISTIAYYLLNINIYSTGPLKVTIIISSCVMFISSMRVLNTLSVNRTQCYFIISSVVVLSTLKINLTYYYFKLCKVYLQCVRVKHTKNKPYIVLF